MPIRRLRFNVSLRCLRAPLNTPGRLEQLRFLENGVSLYVEATPYDTIGVDTEEDLRLVETMLTS